MWRQASRGHRLLESANMIWHMQVLGKLSLYLAQLLASHS